MHTKSSLSNLPGEKLMWFSVTALVYSVTEPEEMEVLADLQANLLMHTIEQLSSGPRCEKSLEPEMKTLQQTG